MITIYGIKNCNTMKKAFDWLKDHHIPFKFHDYKKEGVSEIKLKTWLLKFNIWEVINAKGSTWRLLSDEQKSNIRDDQSAISLMIEKTSVIKRPLVELENGDYLLGFDEMEWSKKLG